jgi:hypothetical protein
MKLLFEIALGCNAAGVLLFLWAYVFRRDSWWVGAEGDRGSDHLSEVSHQYHRQFEPEAGLKSMDHLGADGGIDGLGKGET